MYHRIGVRLEALPIVHLPRPQESPPTNEKVGKTTRTKAGGCEATACLAEPWTQWQGLLVGALVAGLLAISGCGGQIPHVKPSGVTAGMALTAGGLADKGLNDMSSGGLDRAKHRRGVDFTLVGIPQNGTQREAKLRQLVAAHDNPVIAVGKEYQDSLQAVAGANPSTTFAIVDSEHPKLANVTNITFTEEQGSYLMGAVAAWKSKTRHVGFIGGVRDDRTGRYQAGFVAGVRSVEPAARIDVSYLAPNPAKATVSGDNSPELGRAAASTMLVGGADVIYQAAGNSGAGVFDAVVTARASTGSKALWAIGSDTDQSLTASQDHQKVILTSMIKRSDNAVYQFISDYLAGKVTPGIHRYSLADNGVDYATTGGFIDKFTAELDKIKEAIIAGKVQVPTSP